MRRRSLFCPIASGTSARPESRVGGQASPSKSTSKCLEKCRGPLLKRRPRDHWRRGRRRLSECPGPAILGSGGSSLKELPVLRKWRGSPAYQMHNRRNHKQNDRDVEDQFGYFDSTSGDAAKSKGGCNQCDDKECQNPVQHDGHSMSVRPIANHWSRNAGG